ncbi:MAG TPA: hypothetical protein VGF40_05880 [Thermoanaerobaculia bacterium]
MNQHVTILAVLYIICGAILLLIGGGLFMIIAGAGAISGDLEAAAITGIVGVALGGFFLVLSVPSIIAGVGLLGMRPWARILTLILGAFQILNFPFGTALGIYTFWVLLNDQTVAAFTPATVQR